MMCESAYYLSPKREFTVFSNSLINSFVVSKRHQLFHMERLKGLLNVVNCGASLEDKKIGRIVNCRDI